MLIFRILNSFLSWQKKYLSEKHFILILSIVVGIIAGLVAILLKKLVHFIQETMFNSSILEKYFYLLPFIGIFLAIVLSKLLYREKIGHAISDILFAIFRKSGKMNKNKMYSRFFTSSVTVGLGGSVGLEAPIVLTGSAIGSNLAKVLFLSYKNKVLLIGCGSAAVISAIFNAPIAGLIFSIEVILFDITLGYIIPLLAASLTATLTSILLYEDATLFIYREITYFRINNLVFYILLGIVSALIAIFYTKSSAFIEKKFEKIKSDYFRYWLGTSLLVICIFLFPSLYGEGYHIISNILSNESDKLFENSFLFANLVGYAWLAVGFFVCLIIFKCLAFAFTIGAGGAGGTFAPSLFLGCIGGFTLARFVNNLDLNIFLPENTFALVGMAGVLSATQYAPLTAIFLIAELTGGYRLFVPLMVVSAIAYITVSYFNPDSPYIRHLIERGDYVKGSKDQKILYKLDSKKLIEKDFKPINKNLFLKDLIKLIKKSRRNLYPVLNDEKELVGYITLDDVRDKMFDKTLQNTIRISSLMTEIPVYLEVGEKMTSIIEKFEKTQAWNLPVVKNKKYIGFISKSRIFNYYREELLQQD